MVAGVERVVGLACEGPLEHKEVGYAIGGK